HPDIYAGQPLTIIGDILSPAETIATFKRVTGRKAVYASAYSPAELVRHFPEFGENPELVRDTIGMAEYAVEYGPF
ncbi:NmrA/HSCARG family protein, partial [Rhizobium ruizarguesonis]